MNKLLLSFSVLTLLASCGGGGGGSSAPKTKPQTEVEPVAVELEMSGAYIAVLNPLNKQASGNPTGAFTFARDFDEITADVRLTGGPASIAYAQYVHVGKACPTEADDLNRDGFIDYQESLKVTGPILIPLDGDISSQRMEAGLFNAADDYGSFLYYESASFDKFLADLKEEDINLEDDMVNLPRDSVFNLVGRVVVIQGVPESANLPATVASRRGLANFQTLPIACGVITKITKVPGEVDDDETDIPVPEGTSVGGSSGASDGFIPGASTRPPEVTSNGTTAAGSAGGSSNYGDEDDVPATRPSAPVTPERPAPSTTEPTPSGGSSTTPLTPAPVTPEPVTPAPVTPRPTESRPTESRPTESRPTESRPTESRPTEPRPTESRPTESRPTESRPVESTPTEPRPAESRPTESAPAVVPSATPATDTPPASTPDRPADAPANN